MGLKPRPPRYRELTGEELAGLARSTRHSGIREYLGEIAADGIDNYDGKFLAHDGDLVIDGSFDTDDLDLTVWFVSGDLTVGGLFETRCNDGPMMAIVGGDLRVTDLLTAGFLEVCGNLIAGESVVGEYNDGGALIRGDLEAQLFLPFDHPFAIAGDNRAVETIHRLSSSERPGRLDGRFFAEADDGGYRLVTDAINADLRARRSLLVQG